MAARGLSCVLIAGCALLAAAAIGCGQTSSLVPRSGFELRLGREHPLTGRVFHPASDSFVSAERLYSEADAAQFLLLGETHDNPDHHRLQAALVESYLTHHSAAKLGFEMLDQRATEVLARHAFTTPDQLAEQVAWQDSGWPAFALYRPIFSVALARHAELIAAHPNAENVRASMHALPPDEVRSLRLEPPLPAAEIQAQLAEIREAHCGHAPEAMATAMQRAQTYKDAFMARALIRTGAPAVLIAGRGHVRADRGVPSYLRRHSTARVLSVAFIDVAEGRTQPGAYDLGAFDFVVFTPRVSDEDPCEQFRKQLQQMRSHSATSSNERSTTPASHAFAPSS
jgi:uncharacterized iron-regulated protein